MGAPRKPLKRIEGPGTARWLIFFVLPSAPVVQHRRDQGRDRGAVGCDAPASALRPAGLGGHAAPGTPEPRNHVPLRPAMLSGMHGPDHGMVRTPCARCSRDRRGRRGGVCPSLMDTSECVNPPAADFSFLRGATAAMPLQQCPPGDYADGCRLGGQGNAGVRPERRAGGYTAGRARPGVGPAPFPLAAPTR